MASYLPLLTRLTRKLAADKVPDARNEAIRILRERKHMYLNSERLTPAGIIREKMGPVNRAIDRAVKESGHAKSDYKYVGGRAVLK